MTTPFQGTLRVPVRGGTLAVATAGAPLAAATSDVPLVLAVHGITGTHHAFGAFARHLGTSATLVAPDLRGRGASSTLGPPFGLDTHVADLGAVLGAVAAAAGAGRPVVVVGHSMGAYAAARLAAAEPDRVAATVLVDGGIPLPLPAAGDPDVALAALLGPALGRLRMEFASVEDYLDLWRRHPAFAGSPWTDDIAANAVNDLSAGPPPLRPRIAEAAVRADGRDLFDADAARRALAATRAPTLLLWAARGLFDEPRPGLAGILDAARVLAPHLRVVEVPDTNHYQIVLGDRGAAFIAGEVLRLGP